MPRVRLVCLVATFLSIASACADDRGDSEGVPVDEQRPDGSRRETRAPIDAASDAARTCPASPVAYLLDGPTPGTTRALLEAAGFEVRPLALDASPAELVGAIVLASFASDGEAYQQWVARFANDLVAFARRGNVIVALAQNEAAEPVPPFLPADRRALRSDGELPRLYALDPRHPLLAGVPLTADGFIAWDARGKSFTRQGGFEVILAGGPDARRAALLEGAVGRGRVILAGLAPDQPIGAVEPRAAFARAFFANLRAEVAAVCAEEARPPRATPTPMLPGFSAGSSMLAVLPDTQMYSLQAPGIYQAQTGWIAGNRDRLRIPYVLHLGDIVDRNTPLEWERAATAMSLLDGVIPVALVPGNHDYGPGGSARTRETLLNDYFSFDATAALPSFGGAFIPGKLDNTYHLLSVGGRDYVVLALEWGPRTSVIAWANDVMARHRDRYGILITHAYLYFDSRRYNHNDPSMAWNPHAYATAGGVNDGQELWDKLVRHHPFVMVMSGHVLGDGTGYLASVTDTGNICHQMLSNYQFRTLGGEGYLRLLEFLPDQHTVRVFTYSPLLDDFLVEPDQSFSFLIDVPPGPRP